MNEIKLFLLPAMCILMMLSAHNTTAQTVDSGITGDCTWELTGVSPNLTLTISGAGGMGNYTHSNTAPWYEYRSNITILNIQEGVTFVGNSAFRGCSSLTSVSIPNSVTTIGDYAFFNCSGLISVTIGNSVTTIGKWIFSSCSSLTTISVDTDNSNYSSIDGVLFNKLQDLLIQYPEGKTGSYTIPYSVTTIGDLAFYDCSGLTSITIPHSVTTIGEQAFDRCRNVKKLTLGSGVVSIGKFAFSESPLDTLISLAVNPPVLDNGDSVFHCSYDGADYGVQNPSIPVYVACNSSSAYSNAPGWNYFTNIMEDCSSIEDQTLENNISISPNPATESVTVLLPETTGRALFVLYDMRGKALIRQEVSSGDEVEVSDLATGIYLYQITAGTGHYQGKLIKP